MKKEKWKTFVTDRWKVAAPGLLAAFAVCFIFFIYAPLEVYSHSGSGRDRGKAAWCKEISGNLYGCECGTFGNPHDNACDDDCDHRGLPGENHLYM